MKKLIYLLILFPFHIYSAEITLEAVRSYNGNAGALDYCRDAVSSSDGGIFTVGNCSDELSSYALLNKYNSSGNLEWSKSFRDRVNGVDYYSNVTTDLSGNIYAIGGSLSETTNNDILIQKFSNSGNLTWTRKINSGSNSNDVPVDFKKDSQGNILILFNDYGSTSHINMIKIDLNGNTLLHYRLADTVAEGSSMSVDSLNNIYISGNRSDGSFSTFAFLLKINSNGNKIWTKDGVTGNDRDIRFSKVRVSSNNEIYVLGDKQDGFNQFMKFMKLDSSGNINWFHTISMDVNGRLNSKALELDNSGNIFYAGSVIPIVTDNPGGYYAGYIMGRFSPEGDSVWRRLIPNGDIYSGDEIYMKINNADDINILCYMRDPKRIGKLLKYNNNGDSLASGTFNDNAYGIIISLALDNSGNPIGCGTIFQKYNEYDHFVKSYDASCNVVWENKYDSKGFSKDAAGQVSEDKLGNIYVAGYNNRQAILIKYNEAMTEQWKYVMSDSIGYDPYYNFVPSIVLDSSNNIYLATSVKVDSTAYDILITKFDPSGNALHSIRIAAPGNNTAQLRAITTDNKGNLFISGATDVGFIAKYSPSGNQIWVSNYTEAYYYQKLIVKNDEIYFMGDNTIIKYNPGGDPIWQSTFQPNSYVNYFSDFRIDKENSIIACGTGVVSNQSENFIIVKYDSDGNLRWNKYYNGFRNSIDEAKSIAIDSLNNIIVSGNACEFSSNHLASITVLKLDTSGNQIWKKNISDYPSGEIKSGVVKLDKYDNVYVSSGYGGSINFSYLLVKYRSNGDSVWSSVYNNPKFANYSSDFIITKYNSIVMTGKTYGDNTSYDITTLKYSQTSGIQPNITEFPDDFKLEQNYPNPFNPVTVIRYSLSEKSIVTLKIYDLLGKEIATLVNEEQTSGIYNYQFSTVNYQLSSGVYYYKLEAGDFSQVRKMILIK